MWHEVVASVTGEAFAKTPYTTVVEPYHISVETDGHKVTGIRLRRKLLDSEWRNTLPRLEKARGTLNDPHKLILGERKPYYWAREVLQFIESHGSFWFSIRKIDWESAEERWLPETEDERQALQLFSFRQKDEDYRPIPVEMKPERLAHILSKRTEQAYLTVPMAFYREGVNNHIGRRYLMAFYHFYLFIEGLYSEGATKNRKVEANLKQSVHVRDACQHVLDVLKLAQNRHHFERLRLLNRDKTWIPDAYDLIGFLVSIRGNLHHYSTKSTNVVGHPLNQHEFECLSFTVGHICVRLLKSLYHDGRPL